MITVDRPEEIKTLVMTSDADYYKIFDFTMNGESPSDFATWEFRAGAKLSTSSTASDFDFVVTPYLADVDGVQTARISLQVAQASLAALFSGTDNTDKKLTANLLYKQPGVSNVLLAAELHIRVVRGTTTWTP